MNIYDLFYILNKFFYFLTLIFSLPLKKLFYNKLDFWNAFFYDISQFNILIIKILQALINNQKLTPEINNILKMYANNVPWQNSDINYSYLQYLKNNFNLTLIDNQPWKSGSIALIYRAIYNNEKIIIKMKKKDIDFKIKNDIFILEIIIYILGIFINLYNFDESVKIYKLILNEQIDFKREVSNCKKYIKNFNNHKNIIIPNICDELSSKDVICMEFINGLNICEQNIDDPHITDNYIEEISLEVCEIILKSIIFYGFCHADLHTGNFIINEKKIGLYDFGLCLSFSIEEQNLISQLFENLCNNNFKKCSELMIYNYCDSTKFYHKTLSINDLILKLQNLFYLNYIINKKFSFIEIVEIHKLFNDFNLKLNYSFIKFELGLASLDSIIQLTSNRNIGLPEILKKKYNDINNFFE